MLKKVEKDKVGMIFRAEEANEKMEVEATEVKAVADENSPVLIYYNWCKKCGICVAFCPTGCLGRKPDGSPYVANPDKCIHCETCDRLCPDFAITGSKNR
ncbi:MAG: 4Fe-4S binding protein [Candidatus Cloacimonetes bacterium]|nr:4Fe-4S binding protein [Candidatus Cloacimonadota bacterium]